MKSKLFQNIFFDSAQEVHSILQFVLGTISPKCYYKVCLMATSSCSHRLSGDKWRILVTPYDRSATNLFYYVRRLRILPQAGLRLTVLVLGRKNFFLAFNSYESLAITFPVLKILASNTFCLINPVDLTIESFLTSS